MIVPEVAPLLDWRKYEITASYVFPESLHTIIQAGQAFETEVSCISARGKECVFKAEMSDKAHPLGPQTINISAFLRESQGVFDSDALGYFVLRPYIANSATMREKQVVHMEHWVAYRTAGAYLALPATLQFDAERMKFVDKMQSISEYLPGLSYSHSMACHLLLINPYEGTIEGEVSWLPATGFDAQPVRTHVELGKFTSQTLNLRDFGVPEVPYVVKTVLSHRTIQFVLAYDEIGKVYYHGDHGLPWRP